MENNIIDFGEIKVPTSWNDISLLTYESIERYYKDKPDKEFNVIDVLDILTDKSKDEINQLPAEFLNSILTKLSFLATEPEVGKPSNKITIDGEEYSINVMEKMKLGEYVAVDAVLKNNKYDYASMLAVLCRKKGEIYDSKYEAETFEDRKKMFEEQPVIKILPIISFFLRLYTTSEMFSQLYSKVEEAINLTQKNIETSDRIGAFKKLYMNWQMKKYRKLLKSIKYT